MKIFTIIIKCILLFNSIMSFNSNSKEIDNKKLNNSNDNGITIKDLFIFLVNLIIAILICIIGMLWSLLVAYL